MNHTYANIALTLLLWGIYFSLHSVLANVGIKKSIQRAMKWPERRYRMVYSAVAVITLLPVFYFLSTTRSDLVLRKGGFLQYVSLAFSTWGIIVIKLALKGRVLGFLGFKNEPTDGGLNRKGLYQYCRHPLYLGTVLLSVGFWFFIPNVLNMVSILCIFLYLKIGIRLEETKLTEKYGDEYARYMKEVPAVFPDLARLFKSNQGGNS